MLKNKWEIIFFIFSAIAIGDAVFLLKIHHLVNIMDPGICPFCGSKYSFFDGTTVAESSYSSLMDIPIAAIAIFACFFLLVFLTAVWYLKTEVFRDYLSVVFPAL